MRLKAALVGTASLIALGGCARPEVTRVIDGHRVVGRYIDAQTYAAYAIGAAAEARGDSATALRAYERAARGDEESPAIAVRIAAMRCDLGASPAAAFEEAAKAAPAFEPLHRAWAECLSRRHEDAQALAEAKIARSLDPERVGTTLLIAALLERLGRIDEAQRELDAAVAREPGSRTAWRALIGFALRHQLPDAAARAERAIAGLDAQMGTSSMHALPSLDLIDEALTQGDVDTATILGRRARVGLSELAVRAAALGRPREARALATLVTEADPTDASAFVALAVAADLAGDPGQLAAALDGLIGATTPLTTLARLLYAELLLRRVDATAAQAWLTAAPAPTPAPSVADALTGRVDARLRSRLAF